MTKFKFGTIEVKDFPDKNSEVPLNIQKKAIIKIVINYIKKQLAKELSKVNY
jgi:hypothetical protein